MCNFKKKKNAYVGFFFLIGHFHLIHRFNKHKTATHQYNTKMVKRKVKMLILSFAQAPSGYSERDVALISVVGGKREM